MSRAPRTSASVWALLVGVPALVAATLWVLYAWSVQIDERLLADMRRSQHSLAPGSAWRSLRIPREGELRICLHRQDDVPGRACACISEPEHEGGTRADLELVAPDRDAVVRLLTDAVERSAGCNLMVLGTRRFVRYQRLEVELAGDRVLGVSRIYPGGR